MSLRHIIAPLIVACAIMLTATRVADVGAQSVGGGIMHLSVNAPGFCAGSGTTQNPLGCTVVVDGTTVIGTGSAGNQIRSNVTVIDGWFGDGYDGNVTFDGVAVPPGMSLLGGTPESQCPGCKVYIQQRNVYYDVATVGNLVLVATEGYSFYAKTSITMNGNGQIWSHACIGDSGNAGGAGGCAGGTTQVVTNGNVGGAGSTGVGAAGGNGGANVPRGYPGAGGGNGHGGNSTNIGGLAGTFGAAFANGEDMHLLYSAVRGRTLSMVAEGSIAPGGGGGGGDGANRGGGGGGGGGQIVVGSPVITTNNTSRITAGGGPGGAGATAGNTGGGGGGAGGIATVIYVNGSAPTVDVSGGVGGVGNGTGTNGNQGANGIASIYKLGAQ